MTKKRNLVIGVSVVALVFFLVVSSAGLALAKNEPQILKIGCFNPRTGPGAFWGLNTDKGVDLCADQWNKKGGVTVKGKKYKIEMIHEDDKFKGEEAVKAANKLIFTDKVKFIAGPLASAPIGAVAPLVDSNKIVMVSGGFAPDVIKNHKFMFRGSNIPRHSAPAFFKFITKMRPDLKTSAHISPNDTTGWSSTQGDNDACVAVGIEVLSSEFYDPGTQEFTSMLARLLPQKPDFISLTGTPGGISGLIIKQARELGYKGAFVHAGHLTPAELGPIAGWDNAEGIITSANSPEGPACPELMKKAYSDWIAKYGEENAPGFAVGVPLYDTVNVVCWGIEKANSLDPEEVRVGIENLTEMNTLFGKGHWGGKELYGYNHQIFVPQLVSKIENRKLIIIGAEMPWEVPPPAHKWR